MTEQDLAGLLARASYPGMSAVESEVTRAWLGRHGLEYDRVEFQVRLGAGIDPGPGQPEYIRQLGRELWAKRADVVAITGAAVTIVEVKERITPGAVGQLLVYRDLYRREHPGAATIRLLTIGRGAVTDLIETFTAQGVEIEVYP
jgi:hypothetical protein